MKKQPTLTVEGQQKEVTKMAKAKVLVVEDEQTMRDGLRDWLVDDGFEVETAEDGEQALEILGRKEFSVVVLDLKLPGKDGVEVLKDARTQRPDLKAIIITAYPSVETAVEAMKIGAIDYLVKPFAPDTLERLIEETLGPVQVVIKPEVAIDQAPVEAPAVEEAKVEEAKVEEAIVITEEEIPIHLKKGKAHFDMGHYDEALKEFQAILAIAPDSVETRVWIRKAREGLAKGRIGVAEGEAIIEERVEPKPCVWMKMGLVSHRLCTNNYDCLTCEFDQMMQERMASGENPEIAEALERHKQLPGNQRLCRYALTGEVSYRLCTRLFQCASCEFDQMMTYAQDQKLVKLAKRREALRKKETRNKTFAEL